MGTMDKNNKKTIYAVLIVVVVIIGFILVVSYSNLGVPRVISLSAAISKNNLSTTTGWGNFSLSMNRPESVTPSEVYIILNDEILTYDTKIDDDMEWTYDDSDNSNSISDGDTICIRADITGISSGDVIGLAIANYAGSAKYTVP